MINNELLGYVKKQLSTGMSRETITSNLKGAGWDDADINEVFSAVATSATPSTPTSIPISPIASTVTPNVAQAQPIQPMQTNISNTVHTKNKKIIPTIVILILLILAGGAAGYAYYSGMFVSLDDLSSQVFENSKSARTSSFDVSADVDFSDFASDANSNLPVVAMFGVPKVGVKIYGSSDDADLNNIKGFAILNLNVGSFSASLEERIIDNILYFSVVKMPSLGFLGLSDASSYEGKWFSISINELKQNTENSQTSLDLLNGITQEQKDYIYKITQNAHFIKQTKKLSLETVNGELSYHFVFDLDKEGLKTYLESLIRYFSSLVTYNDLPPADLSSLNEALNSIKDFKGEVWIGKSDKFIHKLSLRFSIIPNETKDQSVKVAIVANFGDYNKPVSVVAPTESIPLLELIPGMMNPISADVKLPKTPKR